jgi:N,N'-diacetyllegionaminate synthase
VNVRWVACKLCGGGHFKGNPCDPPKHGRTFVIAEAGSCHDGDIARAFKLVNAAKDAGADACKFQWWSSAERLTDRRNAQKYLPVYQKYKVPDVWLSWLHLACVANGIEFMVTCYLPEDIPFVDLWVKRFKVASFERTDYEFISAHHQYGKEIIISCGMGKPQASRELLESSYIHGIKHLQCVSAYPTPLDQASLGVIRNELYDGYSDHTHNVLTGALAVAAGAKIIEVHFRLSDTDPNNPDYATALSPGQLKDYVALIRQAEVMMGSGVKEPQEAEKAMMAYRVKGESA